MSRTDGKVLLGLCGIGLTLIVGAGCAQKPKNQEPQASAPSATPSPSSATTFPDYPQLYCQSLGKLKLKQNDDLLANLNYFCKDGSATDKLRSLIKAATDAPEDSQAQTKILVEKGLDSADGWSEFVYLWSFVAPIQPVDIKSRPVIETLAKGYTSPTTQLTTKATPLGIESLDDTGFHLKSAKLDYALVLTGDHGFRAEHARTTEFNIYQVGSSEMGFSEEHMTDSQNPNYKYSTMINFSVKDGRPEKSGSVVVSLLHINIFNQGSPSVAQNTAADISKYLADSLYKALR
jgi:hypothetical protein